VHTIHTHTHTHQRTNERTNDSPFAPTHRAQRSLFRPQPCLRLSPTKSRLRIPPPTPCIGPALASTRRNRPSKPPPRSTHDDRLPLDLRPFCISVLEILLASYPLPPPPPNRRSGLKLNPAFPTHYTRHALSTRNLVVQTFLACNPHSSFALSHRASVCACCLSPVVQPIPLAVGSAPSPASSRTLPPTLNFDPAWT
jgi:hypothetical protein